MNKFQLSLLKNLLELMSPAEVGDISIEVSKGPTEPLIEAKLISRNMSFWIYVDGAMIDGEGIDIRYEFQSYPDLRVLAESFLKKADEIITSDRQS